MLSKIFLSIESSSFFNFLRKNNIHILNFSYFLFLHFNKITSYVLFLISEYYVIEHCFSLFFFFYVSSVIFSFSFKFDLSCKGVFLINAVSICLFWLHCLYNLNFFLLKNNVLLINFFKWFYLTDSYLVYFSFYTDSVAYSFTLLTVTIGFFVNLYIYSYFRNEPSINRLISLINSFIASMLILVNSGNLIVFFFGWEMIGITSFFLINFWGERPATLKSAFKAFSFNKVSDAAILIALILIYICFGTLNFESILNLVYLFSELKVNNVLFFNVISFFLLLAAFIKSAQIGFHIWLPDSMEAPVPASALIHSATLVSAGVFLIIRFYPILDLSFYFKIVAALVGALTAFVGGVSAVFQTDLKKILAYSTISHCGFLIFLCSFGQFKLVIVYLFVHGFFKAISFLCVGNIIRFSKNYQDLRRMGSLFKYLPAEFFFLIFSLLNLSGLPFFFGFYSKTLLLAITDYLWLRDFIFCLILTSCITGIFYSFNILYYSFFDIKKARKSIYLDSSDETLKSFYYTNTTIASNVAIFFLIVSSCFLCGYLITFYLLNFNSAVDFYSFFIKIQEFNFSSLSLSLLLNYSFFYWVVIIFSIFLIFFTYFQKKTTEIASLITLFDFIYFNFLF